MAKTLAKALGYDYVDTGAMYRAVTLCAMRHSLIDAEGVADSQAIAEALPKIGIAFRREADGSQHTSLTARCGGNYTTSRRIEQRIGCCRDSGSTSRPAEKTAGIRHRERNRDGRTRHRHHGVPGCGNEDFRYGIPADPLPNAGLPN